MSLGDLLVTARSDALKIASEELERRKFKKVADRAWTGEIEVVGHGKFEADVNIPSAFPDQLPEVYVNGNALPRQIPHVDSINKSCIAAETGLLLDVTNVAGIIRDSLVRAQAVVAAGLDGRNVQDFLSEFASYWNHEASFRVFSIVNPNDISRQITSVSFKRTKKRKGTLFADNKTQAKTWLNNVGWEYVDDGIAFYLPLERPLFPPGFSNVLKVHSFVESLKMNARKADFDLFTRWTGNAQLPISIAFSFDGPNGRILSSATIPKSSNDTPTKKGRFSRDRARSHAGLRFVTASHEMTFCRTYAVQRVSTQRADFNYLLGRGGAMLGLENRCVLIIGCGAVGSHAAERIASVGVGALRLIDGEKLGVDNIYRHTLGMDDVDAEKTVALERRLKSRYPHLSVDSRAKGIEVVISTEEHFILTADLIILATGNETLELRLNKILPKNKPRIHAWLEPLGIGGHVLICGSGCIGGCYQCLFGSTDIAGIPLLGNLSALAQPGQNFTKSISGCSGTFTPFSGLDADQTAIYVARAVSGILTGRLTKSELWSWLGDSSTFVEAGFKVSTRAMHLTGKSFVTTDSFSRRDCPECAL